MAYEQINQENNARTSSVATIWASDISFTCITWEWWLFPSTNWILTIEQFNVSWVCFKREVIKYATRSWDVFSWITRAYEFCVQDDTLSPKTRTKVAKTFTIWDWSIVVSDYNTALTYKNIKDEVESIRSFVNNEVASKLAVTTWGSANAYTATIVTNDTGWVDGKSYAVKIHTPNTGSATININSWGAITFKKNNDENLVANDLEGSMMVEFRYNSGDAVAEITSQIAQTPTPQVEKLVKILTPWEAVSVWNPCRWWTYNLSWDNLSVVWNYNSAVAWNRIWYSTWENKCSSIFTLTNWWKIPATMTAQLAKVWAPTGNLRMKLYLDQSQSSLKLIQQSSNTVAESSLSATISSPTDASFSFTPQVLEAWNYYWVIETDRAVSTVNYAVWRCLNSWSKAYYISDANVWTVTTYTHAYTANFTAITEDISKLYKSSALFQKTSKVICFAWDNLAADTPWNFITYWTVWGQSSLVVWEKYYLANNMSIGLVNWNINVFIGDAQSTTEVFLKSLDRKSTTVLATRDWAWASGTVTYTHDLWKIPSEIKANAIYWWFFYSHWTWTQNSGNKCYYYQWWASLSSSVYAIAVSTPTQWQYGFIKNVTSTSFDVEWFYDTSATANLFSIDFTLNA